MVTPLPLEEVLQRHAEEKTYHFPDRATNYYDRYRQIKDWLTRNIFRNAGAGLAADEGIYYTQHDAGHVDDVIQSAGHILGVRDFLEPKAGSFESAVTKLEPYEVYVLLVAILLHDAGNAQGRDGHERRAFQYLNEMGAVSGSDTVEKRLIAKIARAHGGRLVRHGKDTITGGIEAAKSDIQGAKVRPRLLAAILRLADEISEGATRANEVALKKPYKSPAAVIHNLYCKVVHVSLDVADMSISMHFDIDKSLLHERFDCDGQPTYLIDYIAGRLEKCNRERIYCNRFMAEVIRFEKIRVSLEITDGENDLDHISLQIQDEGYPAEQKLIRDYDSKFDGTVLAARYAPVEDALSSAHVANPVLQEPAPSPAASHQSVSAAPPSPIVAPLTTPASTTIAAVVATPTEGHND